MAGGSHQRLKKNDADGTVLLKKAFEQMEDMSHEDLKHGGGIGGTPRKGEYLGTEGNNAINRGRTNSVRVDKSHIRVDGNLIQNEYHYDVDTERHYLEFSRHSCINAHKDQVNDMKVDESRRYLYSVGGDKRLNVIDLG